MKPIKLTDAQLDAALGFRPPRLRDNPKLWERVEMLCDLIRYGDVTAPEGADRILDAVEAILFSDAPEEKRELTHVEKTLLGALK